jgi:hypothetical protein
MAVVQVNRLHLMYPLPDADERLSMTVWPSTAPARGGRGRPRRAARVRLCGIASVAMLAPAVTAFGAATTAAAEVPPGTPLPPSNYSAQPVCGSPAPGHSSCLAVRLVPRTAAARAQTHPIGITRKHAIRAGAPAEGADGLRPQDLHGAYNLPAEAPIPQTVGIVDAFNDPTAEADLATYDSEFHLPACTKENGCFKKVNQEGKETSLPANSGGWALEVSLDIETTHAVCPNCKIVLVEAKNELNTNLEIAVNQAVAQGATEVSNSYGAPPEGAGDNSAYNHPGIPIVAATGDYGYLNWETFEAPWVGHPDYPSVSPHVVAAGGTRLNVVEGEWKGEKVWNDGGSKIEVEPEVFEPSGHGSTGGGCSESLTAQSWQQAVPDWSEVGCGTKRAAADVSADGDPYSGVAVYDSTFYPPAGMVLGWVPIGGTSLASPIVASVFALAGGSGGVNYPAQTIYEHLGTPALHDVTSGSNGECGKPFNELAGESSCTTAEEAAQCSEKRICLAGTGYDGPSGVGTPDGIAAFKPPAPAVTAVEPNAGSIGGGHSVTVKGTHLLGAIKVEFESSQATEVHVVSATEVTVKTPAHAAGTVNVTVTTPGGKSAVVPADEYTYLVPPPPTVTAVEPTEGSTVGGHAVKIVGTNLEDPSEVHFGTASGTEVHAVSATELTVKTPAHEAEEVDVTVTTPGGTSTTGGADRYTYVTPPPPTVTAVSPSEGSIAGGTTVTVTGTNLEGASVQFGSSAGGEVQVLSASELRVKTPTHAAGAVDVTVTTPGGTSVTSAADRFSFVLPPPEPPAGGSGAPPSGSGTGLTSSPFLTNYSGLTSTPNTFSNFNLLGEQVNGKSGAVKVTVAVFHRGTLHWSLTYREAGKHGKRASTVVFGEGTKAVSGAMILSFSVSPATAAKRALQRALRHRGSLAVVANLTYTADGGSPTAHSASVRVRLSKPKHRRHH